MKAIWGISLVSGLLLGCSYRFSNLVMEAPDGIRTLAVEGVYDTAEEVLPHQLIWRELQSAFAARGKIKLVGRDEADALLRVHVRNSASQPLADVSKKTPRDPRGDTIYGTNPGSFKNLMVGKVAGEQSLSFEIAAEIWDLRTSKLVFDTVYSSSSKFSASKDPADFNITTHFLLYEEARHFKVRDMARGVAKKLVTDFLLRNRF